jgi:hypothetical protein
LLRVIEAVKVAELEPNLKSLCGGQVPVKFTIGVLGFFKVAEHADGAVDHLKKY